MAGEDRKPARLVPWALLSPGGLWLALFFLVPVLALVKIALSTLSDYGAQFGRSFVYAGLATVLAFAIGYPLAYCVAAYGGRWKDLLIGLVVIPFFTSFLIRTIAWTSILGERSFVTKVARGVLGDWFTFTGRSWGVVGGLTYNFLPFMILPIYVALEKIDFRLTEAAGDLYATPVAGFWRVIFPLSLPGVFAGSLLVFIPAAGDFINARFLGSPDTTMIGSVVQDQFLVQLDYPSAAALSLILMGIITVAVLVYSKLFGTEGLAA